MGQTGNPFSDKTVYSRFIYISSYFILMFQQSEDKFCLSIKKGYVLAIVTLLLALNDEFTKKLSYIQEGDDYIPIDNVGNVDYNDVL